MVDSFRPRGFASICEDLRRLRPLQRLPDVYGTLNVLSTHPAIDANRIVLMGASHGGLLTVDAATESAKDTFAGPGSGGFRAFIAMYLYCNVSVPELNSIYAPLRIHLGELDDWTPARPCQEYVDPLKASGQSADIHVYPAAHHAFDDPSLPVIKLPNVPSGGEMPVAWFVDPRIHVAGTGFMHQPRRDCGLQQCCSGNREAQRTRAVGRVTQVIEDDRFGQSIQRPLFQRYRTHKDLTVTDRNGSISTRAYRIFETDYRRDVLSPFINVRKSNPQTTAFA